MAQEVIAALQEQGVRTRSLCADSRAVQPGDVFVARPGRSGDGRRHIAEARARGAAAVLYEADGAALPAGDGGPALAVAQLEALSGWLAHRVCGRPSEKLWMVGVTGTNGKTSVSQWIAQALQRLGRPTTLIGTLGSGLPQALQALRNTTPDALAVHRLLADHLAQGATACAMEVSSIGLDQGRVNGVAFDVAVFTNLSRDHLDYHADMDAYGAAKARLFHTPGLQHAIINVDDAFGRQLAAELAGSELKVSGYSLEDAPQAEIHARNIAVTAQGMDFDVFTPAGRGRVRSPFAGRFNVANLLAVLGTLLASQVALSDALAVLARLTFVPGRLQAVGGTAAPLAVIDYAHTPDALAKALAALRPTAQARGGQLVCVFGCGGNRDAGKRAPMGEQAARGADRVILTSDNPRDERPADILVEIARGAPAARIIESRAAAIRQAIVEADARDVLLIAGRGHETHQEIAGRCEPFSDLEHVRAALQARGGPLS